MRRPISRTTMPSTLTRPERISSSALRRDATPAAETTFCKRTPAGPSSSSGFARRGSPGPRGSFIVDRIDIGQQRTQRRQFTEVGKPEALEEQLRRAVEKSPGVRVGPGLLDPVSYTHLRA